MSRPKAEATKIQVASITRGSRVNGPGTRTVLHLQGCTLKCRGCFNTHTWSSIGGRQLSVEELADSLDGSEGLTVSGGEPFQQYESLIALLSFVKKFNPERSVIVFTGYTRDELIDMGKYEGLNEIIDVLVSGRYEMDNPNERKGSLLASNNQEYILLTKRHTKQELFNLEGDVEVIIDEAGNYKVTGFPSVKVITEFKRSTI